MIQRLVLTDFCSAIASPLRGEAVCDVVFPARNPGKMYVLERRRELEDLLAQATTSALSIPPMRVMERSAHLVVVGSDFDPFEPALPSHGQGS